jgi:hypothetical protein
MFIIYDITLIALSVTTAFFFADFGHVDCWVYITVIDGCEGPNCIYRDGNKNNENIFTKNIEYGDNYTSVSN